MTILQSGMAKSGNYWIWQILQNSIAEAGLPNTSFIQNQPIYPLAQTWELSFKEQAEIDVLDIEYPISYYRIGSIFRMPIADVDDYIAQSSHVWTHSQYDPRCEDIYRKFDHIVYLIRDPRDVLISRGKFHFTPYSQKYRPTGEKNTQAAVDHALEGLMKGWAQQVADFLIAREALNIHIVFYEQFNHQFDTALAALLEYLKIQLDDDALARIRHNVAFSTMQQANPDHVKKGQAYGWMETLSPDQKQRALRLAEPMLDFLGYPLMDSDAEHLPKIPTNVDEKHIRQRVAAITKASQSPMNLKTIVSRLRSRLR